MSGGLAAASFSAGGRDRWRVPIVAVAVVGTLLVYLVWAPQAPDLLAQIARAQVAQRDGAVVWWTGCFGGLSLPTYSVLAPVLMAAVGVTTLGVVAVVGTAIAGCALMRTAIRPTSAGVAYAVTSTADLAVGRVTFAVGVALASWSLVALRARRGAVSALLAVTTCLVSPLAGLFVGLALLAVAVADPSRRSMALTTASVLLAVAAALQFLFPGTGTMPIHPTDIAPAGVACVVVAVVCRHRVRQVAAALTVMAMLTVLIVPGAVGSNMTRLAWIAAIPITIGYARLSRRWLITVVVVVATWPVIDTVQQLVPSADRSTQRGFYQPLLSQLSYRMAATATVNRGARVEVIDTESHAAYAYLAPTFALARGWDRQADRAYNSLFYRPGLLTAAAYQRWLTDLAVGWVAVPQHATLDYAATAEAALIQRGLPYLQPVWTSPDWMLYRFVDAAPLVTGATVERVDDVGVVLQTDRPLVATVRIRWTPYLAVIGGTSLRPVTDACTFDRNGWTQLYLPRAGRYELTSRFDPVARLRVNTTVCASDNRISSEMSGALVR